MQVKVLLDDYVMVGFRNWPTSLFRRLLLHEIKCLTIVLWWVTYRIPSSQPVNIQWNDLFMEIYKRKIKRLDKDLPSLSRFYKIKMKIFKNKTALQEISVQINKRNWQITSVLKKTNNYFYSPQPCKINSIFFQNERKRESVKRVQRRAEIAKRERETDMQMNGNGQSPKHTDGWQEPDTCRFSTRIDYLMTAKSRKMQYNQYNQYIQL